jgi:hypothetical protein
MRHERQQLVASALAVFSRNGHGVLNVTGADRRDDCLMSFGGRYGLGTPAEPC